MRWSFLCLAVSLHAWAVGPELQQHTLPNGLEVIVAENHALPLVTVEIAVRNGSMAEPPELNGLSHLYEHMFFKGNAVIPDQGAYLARMRELGMEFNGTTQTERVNYFFTTTQPHFRDALTFLRDAIVSPLFEKKELERERRVVVGEIDQNEAQPFYKLFRSLNDHVWWKYPSRKDALGNRETVLALPKSLVSTPDDALPPGVLDKAVQTIHDKMVLIKGRYYVPNNSALIVTGDVSAGEVFAQAETLFTAWPRAADPFKKFPLVKHPPLKRTEVVLVEAPVEEVTGQLVWHGPSTVGKDLDLTYAADLLSYVTSDPSSTFQKDLVDSGACVGASIEWFTQKNVGPISVTFEAVPDKTDACVRAVLAELPKMAAPDYASPQQFRNAVTRAKVDRAREREKASELAHVLSFWWASAGTDYYLTYVDHLVKVTPADFARYLRTYVLGKPYVLGALLSPDAKAQGLDSAHFEQLIGVKKTAAEAPTPGASR